MTINERIDALRIQMKQHDLQAYIIPSNDPHQSEYVAEHWQSRVWVSGFTGSAGVVIITADYAGLWTDSRYFLQAEQQLANSELVLNKQKIPHFTPMVPWLKKQLPDGSRVGCDGQLFSATQIEQLETGLAQHDIQVVYHLDLIDPAWPDRPPLPKNEIFELPVTYAGQSRADKLTAIREKMADRGAKHHLVSTLDDIAWILNIRGTDVESNPVAIAFLLIDQNKGQLFIAPEKVPATLLQGLQQDGVQCLPYDTIRTHLKQINDATVLLNPAMINIQLYDALQNAEILHGPTFSTAMKAIKNEVEIGHIRAVMRKDGVALLKLFRWLEATLTERSIPETEVAEALIEFRKAQGDYHDESFAAIVGYQGNGAIVHYRAEPETCAQIEAKGILLLDSGGQYTNGTTDITRTIALSAPTEEQKRNYTLVLKGHIGIATIKFLAGTRGNQIEILARQHLWQHGLNYGHGTGHGVGFFLNVHEGPQALGSGATAKAATPFQVGMLTSNEPGFYKTGEYGIRIENLIVTTDAETTAFGRFLEFETVTLFPIDTQLIATQLLTKQEVNWLNEYHAKVYAELSGELDPAEKEWLREKCQAI